MTDILSMIVPELILTGIACVLFLMGCSGRLAARATAPYLALLGLVGVLVYQISGLGQASDEIISPYLRIDGFAHYIRLITAAVAIILLLMAWPSDRERTGNSALFFGHDAAEFFALFLLSITGLLLVTVASDLIVLFLALELVSIPTYAMVSISRRFAVAQEAGVKYFFLGALSTGLMLFGFSYLYGATGEIGFAEIQGSLRATVEQTGALSPWQLFAVLLIMAGFAFKMAAFPLHFYAGDVYEGAATPVTAFLAFTPKTAGFVALIKLLVMIGGAGFDLPARIVILLSVIAVLTMSIGNVLALLQSNVKRVLAYSSIAHSGYMLVGVAALRDAGGDALEGVLFYLAAYGVMNTGAFGVLMLLPSRERRDAAETFEDLAGSGRRHVALGLAMAISCFSLIGLPLTVGFVGKLLIIKPAFQAGMFWLVIITIINAAVSAAYYLRIVSTMFLRPEPAPEAPETPLAPVPGAIAPSAPITFAVAISAVGTLLLGAFPPAVEELVDRAEQGAAIADAARSAPGPAASPMAAN